MVTSPTDVHTYAKSILLTYRIDEWCLYLPTFVEKPRASDPGPQGLHGGQDQHGGGAGPAR